MSFPWFSGLFLVSGFCGLVDEVAWLRLSMGAFGVSAPFVALFLSAFMGALGLGSWLGGRLCRRGGARTAGGWLRMYAATELGIALSAAALPFVFAMERTLLSAPLDAVAWGSAGYHAAAGLLVAAALLPGCACMGATFPFAMAALRRRFPARAEASFSWLYLANAIGAAAGSLAAAYVLIEWLGLRETSWAAGALSAATAAAAFALSLVRVPSGKIAPAPAVAPAARGNMESRRVMLFITGFTGMAMEVVWVREFTPYLGTTIYAFASILAFYLAATFAGSAAYRALRRRAGVEDVVWMAAGALSLLPLSTAEPAVPLSGALRLGLGIGPLCAALGFLTPSLVDRFSGGDSERAGSAYAVNVLGCVLGPLVAGFLLLPRLPERLSLGVLSLPLFAAGAAAALRQRAAAKPPLSPAKSAAFFAALSALALLLPFTSSTFEEWLAARFENGEVRRDYQASVVAGGEGANRQLLVNGVGVTILTPATKTMAHLPLALLGRTPENALVICFGMGTTFRSLVSWGVDATAVELVPSVPAMFGHFHADAAKVLSAPGARVVIDDGRRFLARTTDSYDVITIDPAPPMTAAGTSFLYSREFYAEVRARLKPGGIFQQWIVRPLDPVTVSAFAAALRGSFPYVRVFGALNGNGWHVLAGSAPIAAATASELAARLPPAAAADFTEWGPGRKVRDQFQILLNNETPVESLITVPVRPLDDDRPVNEYDFLRRRFPALAPRLGP